MESSVLSCLNVLVAIVSGGVYILHSGGMKLVRLLYLVSVYFGTERSAANCTASSQLSRWMSRSLLGEMSKSVAFLNILTSQLFGCSTLRWRPEVLQLAFGK